MFDKTSTRYENIIEFRSSSPFLTDEDDEQQITAKSRKRKDDTDSDYCPTPERRKTPTGEEGEKNARDLATPPLRSRRNRSTGLGATIDSGGAVTTAKKDIYTKSDSEGETEKSVKLSLIHI